MTSLLNIGYNLFNSRKEIFVPTISLIIVLVAGLATGALAVTLPFLLLAMLFMGATGLIISLLWPEVALVLFFCGIIFLTDSAPGGKLDYLAIPDFDIVTGLPSALTTIFLLLTGLTAFRFFFIDRRTLPHFPTIPVIYGGVLFLAAASGFLHGTDRATFSVDLMGMLLPVVCFYLCRFLLNTPQRVWRVLVIMSALGGIKAAALDVAYVAGHGWPYGDYRVVTTDSADLLVFIPMTLLMLNLLVRRDIRGGRAVLAAAACIPMIFAIIFAYRRAQWGGFILSVGLIFLGSPNIIKRRMTFLSLLIFIAIGAVAALITSTDRETTSRITSRIESIFDPTETSNVYHALESRQVLIDLSKSPFLGLGLGSHHTPLTLYENDTVPTNVVHNTFLYIWMKMGLPGLLFFIWAGGHYARTLFKTCKRERDNDSTSVLLPIAASASLWLCMFLTGPTPWYFHETALIALYAAMTLTLAQNTNPIPSTPPTTP